MADIVLDGFHPERERRRESLFSLGNGLLLVRGCPAGLSESETRYPGCYRAGLYDRQTSVIEGQAVGNEALARLPDWRGVFLRIAGAADWLNSQTATVLEYRLALDVDEAVSSHEVLLEDAAGRRTRIVERRLVSMADPACAALRLEVTPENWSGRIEVRSELNGDLVNGNVRHHRLYERRHLEPLGQDEPRPGMLRLRSRTRQSRVEISIAARTRLIGAPSRDRQVAGSPGRIGETFISEVQAGQPVAIEKVAAIHTSRDLAVADPAEAVVERLADGADFDTLRARHGKAWARLWERAGIEAQQDRLARTLRFHAFHLLQTFSPHSAHGDVGFPARGWQEAYNGQVFWDELFVFPFFDHRFPELSRALLLYRYRRLDAARRAARRCGYAGAMFPWRSARTGEEETPRFQYNLLSHRWTPDETRLQRHIGSAIAYNTWRYFLATGDIDFLSNYGAELMVEIARFWASIARLDAQSGRYEIKGVVGPDEYHTAYPGAAAPGLDNNAYTNVMAVWTLCRAREALERLSSHRRGELARFLDLTDEELAHWDHVSRRMRIVFHADGVISQFEGFESLKELDWRAVQAQQPGQRVDWILEARGDTVDHYQVTKQADVLMLLYLLSPRELGEIAERLGYSCGLGELRRTADYYLQRITHESSLSRLVCAGALARIDPQASWRFFEAALRTDLDPPPGSNTEEGVHLGAMAGVIDVLQRHYLGIDPDDALVVDPAPPADLGHIRFAFQYRGCTFDLAWAEGRLRIRSAEDNAAAIDILHAGRRRPLRPGETLAIAPGADLRRREAVGQG